MSNDRMTNVPDFLGELDAGVFINKIAGALNTAALGVLNNGSKGKVVLTFDIDRMGNSIEEKRVMIKHKLQYITPTPRGKVSEEDTTETPMFVNRGGKLTILQEDQGNLFTLGGDPDAKLRTAPQAVTDAFLV
ncbi:hypothetical protein [Klebsiella variicola]|nr:hypothetical protein [Klebsiella variicola]MDZ2604562.1 hypothetical protein [Klebsiella variicola]